MKARYLSVFAVCALAASCTSEKFDTPSLEGKQGVIATLEQPESEILTKGLNWNENKLEFAWEIGENLAVFNVEARAVSRFEAQEAGTTSQFTLKGFSLENGASYVTALPPSTSNYSKAGTDISKLPVSFLGQTQNGSDNTDHLMDYLYASTEASVAENNAINVDLHNQVSWIVLQFTNESSTRLDGIESITMSIQDDLFVTEGTMDASSPVIETGTTASSITATAHSNELTLAFTTPAELPVGATCRAYFTICPVDLKGQNVTFTANIINGTKMEIGTYNGATMKRNMVGRYIVGQSAHPLPPEVNEFIANLNDESVSEINVTSDIDLSSVSFAELMVTSPKTINVAEGCTVKLGDENYFTVNADLTVTGKGTIDNTTETGKDAAGKTLFVVKGGDFTLDGVTLINDMGSHWHGDKYNSAAIHYEGNANITIKNSTVKSGEFTICGMWTPTGTITLQNSYFESNSTNANNGRHWSYAARLRGGKIVIDDCEVKGIQGGLSIEKCSDATINSGKFYTANSAEDKQDAFYPLYVTDDAVVTINGGEFVGANKWTNLPIEGTSAVVSGDNDVNKPYGNIIINGGYFSGKAYNHVLNLIIEPNGSLEWAAVEDSSKPEIKWTVKKIYGYGGEELPAAPAVNGNVLTVNTENAQYTLDGAYGSLDGKTIKFSAGTYDRLYFGRSTKFAGSNTVYRHGAFENEPMTFEALKEYKNQTGWTEGCYYTRKIEDLTFTAEAGAVLSGMTYVGGRHIYGSETSPVYDYVLENTITSTNNSYYQTLVAKNIVYDGIHFQYENPGTEPCLQIATSNYLTDIDGITITGCFFTGNGAPATTPNEGKAAIRFYWESQTENPNNGVKNLTVENTEINNFYQGIYTSSAVGVKVDACFITNTVHNAVALQNGNVIMNQGNLIITNNTFANIGDRIIRFGNVGSGTSITITDNLGETNTGDANGEVMKAGTLEDGITYDIHDNYWGNGKVYNKELRDPIENAEQLKEALAAVTADSPVELTLAAGEFSTKDLTFPSNATITLKGAGEGNTFINAEPYKAASGCNLVFENLTIVTTKMAGTELGFQHTQNCTFRNVTFKGETFTYSSGADIYENCTFEPNFVNGTDKYSIWCYGGVKTVFNNCTFKNNKGKGILVYNHGDSHNYDITVKDCKFLVESDGTTETGTEKGAIEIHTETFVANTSGTINLSNISYDEAAYGAGLWNEVNNNTKEKTTIFTIIVNGVTVQKGSR